MRAKPVHFAAAMLLLSGVGAWGQSTAPAPDSSQTVPDKAAPATDLSSKGGTLSDKLSDTNGVIHPTAPVDPKIQKTAPATGTMEVIPPPGSPGGRTDVQPK